MSTPTAAVVSGTNQCHGGGLTLLVHVLPCSHQNIDTDAERLDTQLMIDALVRIAEEDASKFRNVVPAETGVWIRAMQAKAWEAGKDDSLWIDPTP